MIQIVAMIITDNDSDDSDNDDNDSDMFIKIILYSLKFSKTIYLYLRVNEETVFKIFNFCHK